MRRTWRRRAVVIAAVAAVLLTVIAIESHAFTAQFDLERLGRRAVASARRDVPFSLVALAALVVIVGLEARYPARPRPRFSPGVCLDLLWGLTAIPASIVLLAGYVEMLDWVSLHALGPFKIDLAGHAPLIVLVAVSFVIGDFLSWVYHYLKHNVAWLWRFHAIHHSTIDMNPFADARVHFLEYFVNRTFMVIPFFLLGGDARDGLVVMLLVQLWYARFYHSNVRTNLGPLRHVLVTPQYHRMHHSIDRRDADQNYGNFLTVWDRAFGTMVREYDRYPATGVADPSLPNPTSRNPFALVGTYVAQYVHPFRTRMATGTTEAYG